MSGVLSVEVVSTIRVSEWNKASRTVQPMIHPLTRVVPTSRPVRRQRLLRRWHH